jgi:hypothetical protein
LQIVCNGQVAKEIRLTGQRDTADASGMLDVDGSGWCILRAFSDQAEYPILDLYPYATTSPVYIQMDGVPMRHAEDADYFVNWMDRLISTAQKSSAWNNDEEKQQVISLFQKAKQKYQALSR